MILVMNNNKILCFEIRQDKIGLSAFGVRTAVGYWAVCVTVIKPT